MRYQHTNARRAVILMVVLSLLTLFALVGITFVLYADAQATTARVSREAETAQRADVEPEQALAFFLNQFIYDVPDTVSGVGSGLRGHSLARTMYGSSYPTMGGPGTNVVAFNGVGRLHYTQPTLNVDDYTLVNYTWFLSDGFLRDPERFGQRTNAQFQSNTQPNPYIGGNAPYTYPDLNSFFLAAVKADGTVLAPSYHRNYTGFGSLAPTNPNWYIPSSQNPALKYMVARPRPADHNGFPATDDAGGDVKNLVWAPGGNDSIWIDVGAPVMTAPDGMQYKMLFAPLIFDLNGRINLNTAGNILAYSTAMTSPTTWQTASGAHVSNQGWGPWEVNLSKVLYGDQAGWSPTPSLTPPTPPEWMRLLTGVTNAVPSSPPAPKALPGLWVNNPPASPPPGVNTLIPPGVVGRYVQNPSLPAPPSSWTPTTSGAVYLPSTTPGNPLKGNPAPYGNYPHFYAPVDFNGMNDNATPVGSTPSTRPVPPGAAPNNGNAPTPIFPMFQEGYLNGGTTEDTNHPLLFNIFHSPLAASIGTRLFRASDMEALLRPNLNTFVSGQGPVDTGASAVVSDLMRLCPSNFGPSQTNMRFRNLVTTLSWDLGVPAVSPYWWNGMPAAGYLTPNANPLLPPTGQAVSFPALPPSPTISNNPGVNPITSEFGPDWHALSANTLTYLTTTNPMGYTSPGARIRLNRPLPPYPHLGSGTTPPYQNLPPNTPNPTFPTSYGQAYDLTNAMIASQYQAALNARQALANDIYRRLLAVTAAYSPFNNPTNPAQVSNPPTTQQQQDLANLATRRWLAQLAVNIVDYIDEDDISTPFNFYTLADGLNSTNLGATTGGDDPGLNPANYPYTATATNNAGANPLYWVFGTELPKVVLNEVLAEALNPSPSANPSPIPGESVKVWVELFNTMPTSGGTNTQPQDNYRVPLYITLPGANSGYSPYRVTIAQTPMHQRPSSVTPPVPGATNYLPDASCNVLGKAYIGNAYSANPPGTLPQSTTDVDFSPTTLPNGVPLSQNLSTPPLNPPVYQQPSPAPPGSRNLINAGVDPQGYFLIGPKSNLGAYQTPFVSPGLPNSIPVLQTDSLSYAPTAASWPTNVVNDVSERTTGLTVMLRRLANPYLPFNPNPSVSNPNNPGNYIPNPVYNPYMTVDYIQNVPIQSTQNPPYASRGKTQPYASYTHSRVNANGVPQALSGTNAQNDSPVVDQMANSTPTPQGATTTNNVTNTFGFANYPLPPSGNYDWLVHLDRAPISPIELLHVSAWPPYMLTQRFMLGSNNLNNSANTINPPNAGNALYMFGHYAPWLDAPPPEVKIANLACPWWFDGNVQGRVSNNPPLVYNPAPASHRLSRLFEFLESGDRAFGVNGLGRIPGKVNINTIWDTEILRALVDANAGMMTRPASGATYDNVVDQVFTNLLLSRSPSGSPGPVGIAEATDRPFLPLSIGLNLAGSTQFPTNGTSFPNIATSVSTDTMFRLAPNNTLLLFQNPGYSKNVNGTTTTYEAPDNSGVHPYLQTQLLTKLYNNITTRSNTFAVVLTVGFFQVTDATTTPPTLGPEVGRSEGRQVRHRMFAIVDRTNLAVFATAGSPVPPATTVMGPTPSATSPSAPYNPTGSQTIQLSSTVTGGTNAAGQPYLSVRNPTTGVSGVIQAGTQLVIDAATAIEETITVTSVMLPNPTANPPVLPQITANFTLPHGVTVSIIQRGNPGPWTLIPYDPRQDPLTVLHYSIIK